MNYTKKTSIHAVTLQFIAPIEPRVAKISASVRISQCDTTFNTTELAAYAELALSKTNKKNKQQISALLEKHGIEFSVGQSLGYIHFSITSLDEVVPQALALLEEIFTTNEVNSNELAIVKQQFVEKNRIAHDNAGRIASISFTNALHTLESPLRQLTLEEEFQASKTLSQKRITTIQSALRKGEWTISYTGNEHNLPRIERTAKKIAMTANHIPLTPYYVSTHPKERIDIPIKGSTNVEVRIGNTVPITMLDDDYAPLFFGLEVLGGASATFSSRLMHEIRERRGLTYGIYSSLSYAHAVDNGHWQISTFFAPHELDLALQATVHEIERIVRSGITEKELVMFKNVLQNKFLLGHDSNARRIALYHTALIRGHGEIELLEFYAKLQNLTRSDIRNALKKFIDPSELVIATAGLYTQQA